MVKVARKITPEGVDYILPWEREEVTSNPLFQQTTDVVRTEEELELRKQFAATFASNRPWQVPQALSPGMSRTEIKALYRSLRAELLRERKILKYVEETDGEGYDSYSAIDLATGLLSSINSMSNASAYYGDRRLEEGERVDGKPYLPTFAEKISWTIDDLIRMENSGRIMKYEKVGGSHIFRAWMLFEEVYPYGVGPLGPYVASIKVTALSPVSTNMLSEEGIGSRRRFASHRAADLGFALDSRHLSQEEIKLRVSESHVHPHIISTDISSILHQVREDGEFIPHTSTMCFGDYEQIIPSSLCGGRPEEVWNLVWDLLQGYNYQSPYNTLINFSRWKTAYTQLVADSSYHPGSASQVVQGDGSSDYIQAAIDAGLLKIENDTLTVVPGDDEEGVGWWLKGLLNTCNHSRLLELRKKVLPGDVVLDFSRLAAGYSRSTSEICWSTDLGNFSVPLVTESLDGVILPNSGDDEDYEEDEEAEESYGDEF